MREDLIGYVLGALDESERLHIEKEIELDSELRDEVERLRAQLLPLDNDGFDPPSGLAAETCRLVEVVELGTSTPPPKMSTANEFTGRTNWRIADIFVACGILVSAGLLFFPVIASSRHQSQVMRCQENVQRVGMALQQYADMHVGLFPGVDSEKRYATAGIYAPILFDQGYIQDARYFICPTSANGEMPDGWTPPTLAELRNADPQEMVVLRVSMGGTYGYQLGYINRSKYQPPRNQYRPTFAIMSDMPSTRGEKITPNHGGRGCNVLFEDGHVVFVSDLNSLQLKEDIFRSDRGIVEPGRHVNDSVIARSGVSPFQLLADDEL